MTSKIPGLTTISTSEADELRVVVSELNESIAYLSKMVLQLQKSINETKGRRPQSTAEQTEKPKTVH